MHIVIVGAGFGGLNLALGLKNTDADITLIDRNNYHLFQPLLYQVATAGLSATDISYPIRSVLSRQKNVEVILGEVTGADITNKRLFLEDRSIHYDTLIFATGARHSYFGHEEWEAHAPGLKGIEDAVRIRSRILLAFEKAEIERNPEKQNSLLTFAIVGGGPTGVELAGAIAEIAHRALARDFRHINPHSTRVLLIEAGPRILANFPESLSRKASQALERLGVEIRVGTTVEQVGHGYVGFAGQKLPAENILWAAGVRSSPAGQWLKVPTDKQGRVRVKANLEVPDLPNVFVIGDAAHFPTSDGRGLPGVAQVAIQQGQFVAKLLKKRLKKENEPEVFKYFDKGNMATIGRSSAIADLGAIRVSGLLGWLLWSFVHVLYLIGFRNRVLVMIQWAWAYLTFQKGARLITRL